MNKFIVVITRNNVIDEMKAVNTEQEILKLAGLIPDNDNDPREIYRIFSVTHEGTVTHYHIEFKGRLKLVATPMPVLHGTDIDDKWGKR